VSVSRRGVLLGAAGAAGAAVVGGGSAIGWSRVAHRVDRLVHATPEPAAVVPSVQPGRVVSGSFSSAARGGRTTGWSVAYPPGAATDARLAVTLVLHGRGSDHRDAFGSLALDRYLAAAVHDGVPPFALASVDGGDHSYWHRRADGDDPQAMILDEFLPLLADRGLVTRRVGLFGWSMGGYGALLLAEQMPATRAAAVAVDSPALWRQPGDSAPGAFDDATDFRRNDVFAGRKQLRGTPVRVAIGTSDPFYAATRAFVAGLPQRPQTYFGVGGHTVAFWRHSAPAQLRFLGTHIGRTVRVAG
jgi:enterochelin esterase-like enzyme